MKKRFKKIWVVLTLILTLQSVFQFYDVGSYGAVTDDDNYFYEKCEIRDYSIEMVGTYSGFYNLDQGFFYPTITYEKTSVYTSGNIFQSGVIEYNEIYALGYREVYRVAGDGLIIVKLLDDYSGNNRNIIYSWFNIVRGKSSKGNCIQTLIAKNGTYPDNGIINGYWYVKKGLAYNPPTISTNYTDNQNISVGKNLEISGSYNDLDSSQNVGVKYKIENTSGTVVVQDTILQDFIKSNNETHNFNKVIDLSSLTLGSYKLKVWAEDSLGISSTVKTYNLNMLNEPNSNLSISTKSQSMSLNITTEATQGDLLQAPFKIVVSENGSEIKNTGWLSGNNSSGLNDYSISGLKPNTKYTVKAYISGLNGVTTLLSKEVCTLPNSPEFEASFNSDTSIYIKIIDDNNSLTKYQITINGKEVNLSGSIKPDNTDEWLLIPEKVITISGIDSKEMYVVGITAKNQLDQHAEISTSKGLNSNIKLPNKISLIKQNSTDTTVEISWDKVYNAVDYSYEIKEYDTGNLIDSGKTTQCSLSFKELKPSTIYEVKVISYNGAGTSNPYSQLIKTKQQKPIAPTFDESLTKIDNNSVNLTWNKVDGAYSYDLEIDGQVVDMGKKNSYIHKSLISGTQHTYRIKSKNATGESDWSGYKIIKTTTNTVNASALSNLSLAIESKSAVIKWDEVANTDTYKISIDGQNYIESGNRSYFKFDGLESNTSYTATIKCLSYAAKTTKDFTVSFKTKPLSTPSIVNVEDIATGQKITWSNVAGAQKYLVIKDESQITDVGNTLTYTVDNQSTQNEGSSYRVAAVNASGQSSWSSEVFVFKKATPLQTPVNLKAMSLGDQITVTWSNISDVQNAVLELEVDGVLIESFDKTSYVHDQLQPNSVHTYKVRTKNPQSESEWSNDLTACTLPELPKEPTGIKVDNTSFSTLVSWDDREDISGYDIAILGGNGEYITKSLGKRSNYKKTTSYGEELVFKVRGKNILGIGEWSKRVVNNSIKVSCKTGDEVDLGLTATSITDFKNYTLQVTYNPDVFDITDICGYTKDIELEKGKIGNTGITIVDYIPGKVVFKVDKDISEGVTWSGIVNNMKFKPKLSGVSYFTYTVFDGETE